MSHLLFAAQCRCPSTAFKLIFTLLFCLGTGTVLGAETTASLNLKNMDIADVMEMLSRKHRINILLGEGVSGEVSLNLYDVTHDQAIRAVAEAAGYAVEKRRGGYFIVSPESVGRLTNGVTSVRRFKLNYADPDAVAQLLETHLSQFGEITTLPERNLIIASDLPQFLRRIERLVKYADETPSQVLIEAQILEVTLNDEDSYGINWSKLFESDGGAGSFGGRGLFGGGGSANTGFLFELVTPNVDVQLSALQQEGRVRTLSTPTLVALDNQEASVVIGDRRGYQVTTTINQVTTESVEFLESGVILRVTPSIDADGKIMMDIHPEVSTGTVDANGIPSQTTTEVTTRLLVPDGETVFIGGLIKHTQTQTFQRVPLLGRLPGIKSLFRNKERNNVNTETIVLITPRLQRSAYGTHEKAAIAEVERAQNELEDVKESIQSRVLDEEATLLDDPVRSSIPNTETRRETSTETKIETSTDSQVRAHPMAEQALVGATRTKTEHLAYAVQVMQMNSESGLQEFIRSNQLDHLSYVPVATRKGTAYALLLGEYPTRKEAEHAATKLPVPLAHIEPWIRSTTEFTGPRDCLACSNGD